MKPISSLGCERAPLGVKEQSDSAGRSLVKRGQQSQPVLISAMFSFLFHPSDVYGRPFVSIFAKSVAKLKFAVAKFHSLLLNSIRSR